VIQLSTQGTDKIDLVEITGDILKRQATNVTLAKSTLGIDLGDKFIVNATIALGAIFRTAPAQCANYNA
jgi:hypothetical protein